MTVREQLEGKQIRRVVVPVPVADVGRARLRVAEATQALQQVSDAGMPDAAAEAARAVLDEAQADLAACVADVRLRSVTWTVTEAIQRRNLAEDGSTDYERALPAFLAVLCEDDDLRDQEWWTTWLASDLADQATVAGLITGVMWLVADVVSPVLPKD